MGKWILALVLVAAVQIGVEWYTLPAVIASHFDIHGMANGTMPRAAYCALHAGVVVLLALIFGLMPVTIRRMPHAMINLPHRDYWLASSRAEASMERLDGLLKTNGVITLAFVTLVMALVHRANLGTRTLDTALFLPLLAAFIAAMVWNTVRLFRSFPRPPGGDAA